MDMKANIGDEISKVAYELWEKGGCQSGREIENWLEAERIVLIRSENKSTPVGKTKKTAPFEKIPVELKQSAPGQLKKESTEKKAPGRKTTKKNVSTKESTKESRNNK